MALAHTTIKVNDLPLNVAVAASLEDRKLGVLGMDIDAFDGLLFAYDEDSTARFHMHAVTRPLTVLFFDANGYYLGHHDMKADSSAPVGSPSPFRWALEIPTGRFHGFGPGTRLNVD